MIQRKAKTRRTEVLHGKDVVYALSHESKQFLYQSPEGKVLPGFALKKDAENQAQNLEGFYVIKLTLSQLTEIAKRMNVQWALIKDGKVMIPQSVRSLGEAPSRVQ